MAENDLPDHRLKWEVWIGLSLAAGAVVGLIVARAAARHKHAEIVESVEELRERTQRVLDELTDNIAVIRGQSGRPENEASPHAHAGNE